MMIVSRTAAMLCRRSVHPQAARQCGAVRGLAVAVAVAGALTACFGYDMPDKVRQRLHALASEATWRREGDAMPPLTRKVLVDAVEAMRVFVLNHQKPEGNFVYAVDIRDGHPVTGSDNQVRQAGAVWALTMLCAARPTEATRRAAIRGLDFFFRRSRPLSTGTVAPTYPLEGQHGGAVDDRIKSNMVAVLSIALMDFIRSQRRDMTEAGIGLFRNWLDKYIEHLQAMELGGGGWSQFFSLGAQQPEPESNGFVDGECLLAYCLAARYCDRKDLIPRIEDFAPRLAEKYLVTVREKDPDSDRTRGFSQWGAMAFAEYFEAGWKDADLMGDACLALAWWLLDVHDVEHRVFNMAWAVEGLLAAYRVAKARGDAAAMERIDKAVRRILKRVLTYEVGGPFKDYNAYLRDLPSNPSTYGGVLMMPDHKVVRIDSVQHQLHACLMALDLLFPERPREAKTAPAGGK